MRRILILGSTGSIGVQALDVVERSDQLEVAGLAAQSSWEPLVDQAKAFGVDRIALADEESAARAAKAWPEGTVLAGAEGLVELITDTRCDLVLIGGPPLIGDCRVPGHGRMYEVAPKRRGRRGPLRFGRRQTRARELHNFEA